MRRVILFSIAVLLFAGGSVYSQSAQEILDKASIIIINKDHVPVVMTVAKELREFCKGRPEIKVSQQSETNSGEGGIFIAVTGAEEFKKRTGITGGENRAFVKVSSKGSCILATAPHLLYAAFRRLTDDWIPAGDSGLRNGKLISPKFKWITGRDGFFGSRRRFTRNYDPEASIRELARLGCSHVFVNALAQPIPLEVGPPGEIYYRFYVSSPDLDQFTETELNKGTYPPEYLNANMTMLKRQAALAVKYGLTPGMHICNPRSVPESLLEKYPFLRGARIDHPFRAFRPRYTLTLGHPVVRWHYAQMMKNILLEAPEISFVETFLNDSGSGFEHTVRLYPGRNGGPYIVREWVSNEEFAEKAAGNVIRYYKILRDAAREVNPRFRILVGLRAIHEEEEIIVKGMTDGIDRITGLTDVKRAKKMAGGGSDIYSAINLRTQLINGLPFPWLAFKRLQEVEKTGLQKFAAAVSPLPLAPYDINREILCAFQLGTSETVDAVVKRTARSFVEEKYADDLVNIWKLSDETAQAFPRYPLYGDFAFEWNRLWVRPLVPDIGKIPEKEREYYQKYIISIFNNPQNVDLNADCLWELYGIELSDNLIKTTDEHVWKPLDASIGIAESILKKMDTRDKAYPVFAGLAERLKGYRAYCRTLRNTAAWIAGVHGYLQAKNEQEKEYRLDMVREMIDNEIENIAALLKLWQTAGTNFMPVYNPGETWFQYGDNFGELLKLKLALMKQHKNDIPYIDPDYMWRMPEGFPVPKEEYLKY